MRRYIFCINKSRMQEFEDLFIENINKAMKNNIIEDLRQLKTNGGMKND